LFSDALNLSFDNFMEEDLVVANKLGLFVSNIKKYICHVLDISFHFQKHMMKKKPKKCF
jgi:hypothetical protein